MITAVKNIAEMLIEIDASACQPVRTGLPPKAVKAAKTQNRWTQNTSSEA